MFVLIITEASEGGVFLEVGFSKVKIECFIILIGAKKVTRTVTLICSFVVVLIEFHKIVSLLCFQLH